MDFSLGKDDAMLINHESFESLEIDDIIELKPIDNKMFHDTLEIVSKTTQHIPLESKYPELHPDVIYKYGYLIVDVKGNPKFMHEKHVVSLVYPETEDGLLIVQLVLDGGKVKEIKANSQIADAFLHKHGLQRIDDKFYVIEEID